MLHAFVLFNFIRWKIFHRIIPCFGARVPAKFLDLLRFACKQKRSACSFRHIEALRRSWPLIPFTVPCMTLYYIILSFFTYGQTHGAFFAGHFERRLVLSLVDLTRRLIFHAYFNYLLSLSNRRCVSQKVGYVGFPPN